VTLRPSISQVSEMFASKPQTHKSGLRFIVFFSAVAPQTGAWQTLMIMSPPFSSAVPSFVEDQDEHISKCPVDSPPRAWVAARIYLQDQALCN
jgi:hypothetical protein